MLIGGGYRVSQKDCSRLCSRASAEGLRVFSAKDAETLQVRFPVAALPQLAEVID